MTDAVFPAATVREQIAGIFSAWGMADDHVAATTELVIEADLRGIESHGLGMLPTYAQYRREGRLNVRPDIRTVVDLPAITLIDADHGLGHVPASRAMQAAIDKTKAMGVAVSAVRASNHFGAAGVYSTMALEHGLIGFSCTGTTQRSIVPTFARDPMYSTNPIAFAAPTERNRPFSLDMATSTVAVGKINIARRAGKPLPVGWAMTPEGTPETDAAAAFHATPKRMTPVGGTRELGSHKGYGLAIMVDILSSVLSGANFGGHSLKTGEPTPFIEVGHFFMALDPDFFRGEPGAFEADLDALVDLMHGTTPVDPSQPVLVAGEPEWEARDRRVAEGFPVTRTLCEEIREVAAEAGAPFLLEAGT